jgi:hypothetical protein
MGVVSQEGVVVQAPYYPYPSYGGVKFTPTVTDHNASRHCRNCQYLERCHRLVTQRNGFALCERLMSYEVFPGVGSEPRSEEEDGHDLSSVSTTTIRSRILKD